MLFEVIEVARGKFLWQDRLSKSGGLSGCREADKSLRRNRRASSKKSKLVVETDVFFNKYRRRPNMCSF